MVARYLIFSTFFILVFCLNQAYGKTIYGKAKIIDGDTIYLNWEKIRFKGIDTPELKQTCNKNNEVFGKCNNPNFHGHNYELIVSVTGKINPETGYVIDMGELKKIIKNEVEERLDHKNLNLDIPHFSKTIPSAENICIYIYDILERNNEI